jgi:hypothetical protein
MLPLVKGDRVEEFGAPEVMRLVELPDPVISEDQVLVQLRAVGVNPVETYIRAGAYAKSPPLPYTPGNDGSGLAVAVGAKVSGFKPGDRVFLSGSISGTYTNWQSAPARSMLFRIMSPLRGALSACPRRPIGPCSIAGRRAPASGPVMAPARGVGRRPFSSRALSIRVSARPAPARAGTCPPARSGWRLRS